MLVEHYPDAVSAATSSSGWFFSFSSDTVSQIDDNEVTYGQVVAVGPGCKLDDGTSTPVYLKTNDIVILPNGEGCIPIRMFNKNKV